MGYTKISTTNFKNVYSASAKILRKTTGERSVTKNTEERENSDREITSACFKRSDKNFILHYRYAVRALNIERLRMIKEQKQKTLLCYYIA